MGQKWIYNSIFTSLLFLFAQCKQNCEKPAPCQLQPDAGGCLASIPKYYYDHSDKKCKEFVWGGCGGVVPFESIEKCQESCDCQ